MRMPSDRLKLLTASGLVLAGAVVIANGTRFSDFSPLASQTPSGARAEPAG
jgi:hypothetical protein